MYNEDALVAFFVVFGVIMLIALLFGLVLYIVQSIATYKIARNRGIANPWLTWLPIGNNYIMGAIGDDITANAQQGANRPFFRFIMPGCGVVAYLLAGFGTIVPMVSSVITAINGGYDPDAFIANSLFSSGFGALGGIASTALLVLTHVMLYKIYNCYSPSNTVTMLVLGIIFPVCIPFFLFSQRKKAPFVPFTVQPAYGGYQYPPQNAQNPQYPPQAPQYGAPQQPYTPEQPPQPPTDNNQGQ